MRLFIAEKPSLGRAIAENLGKGSKKDGYITLNGGNDVVTWCFGHILEQYNPDEYDEKYKKWNLLDLPIIPSLWKLKVKSDASKQFKVIKKLMGEADYIVNAGDPDREGQLLIDEVLEYCGNKKPVKRILLNALDAKSVKEALDDLRDNKDFTGLRDSARARSQADWLVGMNLTRGYTIKTHEAGYDGVIHVGRVQTPTLALVVRREDAIEHFKPTTHYLASVIWKHENGLISTTWKMPKDMDGLDEEGRLLSKDVASGLLTKIQTVAENGDGASIKEVVQKKQQSGQRLPYSLSTLQVDAGRRFGYSPQQVLDAMQSLYEKKLTTYPRSDCEYLPTNQLADKEKILKNLAGLPVEGFPALVKKADTSIVSRAWNDKKISAHHALIPTTEKPNFGSLPDIEQKLYLLVATAYLAQFYPIHVYKATKITITCGGETFTGNGKQVLIMGWKELYIKDKSDKQDEDEDTPSLPEVQEGDSVAFGEGKVKEKVTAPPKHFTESTLLQAMKEIYKYVKDKNLAAGLKECKGIGTEATRAGIIELLKKAGFMTVEKKKLVPTAQGRMVVKLLPDSITYPDTTALWEAGLDAISEGKSTLTEFLGKQTDIINNLLEEAKTLKVPVNKDVPKCPTCGRPLKRRKGKTGFFWGCSGYPECKTTVPDKKGKPDFTAKKKSSSLTGKEAKYPKCGKKLRQIKGKFGLFWGCEDKACGAVFSDYKDKPVVVKCPSCDKGYLLRTESKKHPGKFFWYCSDHCGGESVWDKDGLPDIKEE